MTKTVQVEDLTQPVAETTVAEPVAKQQQKLLQKL